MAFDIKKNEDRILKAAASSLKKAGIKDAKGFEIVPGFIAPTIQKEISKNMSVAGPAFSQVAVIAKSTGLVYYLSLAILFPDEDYE